MSEAKHTPGPWKWATGSNLEGPAYTDVIDAAVSCGRWCEGGTARLVISDADRALIAAAPDLLEALRELHEAERAAYPSAEHGQDAQTAWVLRIEVAHALAVAAIAKATGSAQ